METVTQFIYASMKKTPTVITPTGKQITYNAIEKSPTNRKHCWLCMGDLGGSGYHKKTVIKQTFTDSSYARGSGSDYICDACTWCLSQTTLRNYSIYATSQGLFHPDRSIIRNILLNPPDPPWFLCCAVSGQKWLHFKGRVNYANTSYWIMLEETPVQISNNALKLLLGSFEWLYSAGFTKDEILNCNFQAHKINKAGMCEFEKHAKIMYKAKGSRLLAVCHFIAKKDMGMSSQ